VGLGLAWNIFGVVQFLSSLNATETSLMAQGLTAEQSMVMLNYPTWMTVAFAVGVFGGIIGSVLLALKSRFTVPVFTISLIAYIILYIGDITEGVFAALGASQVIILTFVVTVAAGLLWYAKKIIPSTV
jgi:hypothetical protein